MKKTKSNEEELMENLPEENEEEKDISETDEKEDAKKKINVNNLIEKSKKGQLSPNDLDAALEEMNYDIDSIDELYETLEDEGIGFENAISTEEMNEIKNEVEK